MIRGNDTPVANELFLSLSPTERQCFSTPRWAGENVTLFEQDISYTDRKGRASEKLSCRRKSDYKLNHRHARRRLPRILLFHPVHQLAEWNVDAVL